MSYLRKGGIGDVVVCDLCGAFGAVFDRAWREMRCTRQGQPLHLCQDCRRSAVWCEAHAQYHRPEALHRRACVCCGGLFTSEVRQQITRCPACRRRAPEEGRRAGATVEG